MVVVDDDVGSLRRKRRVKLLFIFPGRTEDRHGGAWCPPDAGKVLGLARHAPHQLSSTKEPLRVIGDRQTCDGFAISRVPSNPESP